MSSLPQEIRACRLCAERFSATVTRHAPRPVVWFHSTARLLIAGQAPGLRVHESGRPFTDRSGERLRQWMNIDADTFYDQSRVAIVPMAFCFPGYDKNGSDLPPPPVCAHTWRDRVMEHLRPRLTLVVGGHAIKWHLGSSNVTETVRAWREHAPAVFPLPHPSWRNTAWLRKNPWFEMELLPELRKAISVELGS